MTKKLRFPNASAMGATFGMKSSFILHCISQNAFLKTLKTWLEAAGSVPRTGAMELLLGSSPD